MVGGTEVATCLVLGKGWATGSLDGPKCGPQAFGSQMLEGGVVGSGYFLLSESSPHNGLPRKRRCVIPCKRGQRGQCDFPSPQDDSELGSGVPGGREVKVNCWPCLLKAESPDGLHPQAWRQRPSLMNMLPMRPRGTCGFAAQRKHVSSSSYTHHRLIIFTAIPCPSSRSTCLLHRPNKGGKLGCGGISSPASSGPRWRHYSLLFLQEAGLTSMNNFPG